MGFLKLCCPGVAAPSLHSQALVVRVDQCADQAPEMMLLTIPYDENSLPALNTWSDVIVAACAVHHSNFSCEFDCLKESPAASSQHPMRPRCRCWHIHRAASRAGPGARAIWWAPQPIRAASQAERMAAAAAGAAAAVAEVPWQALSSPSALREARLRVGRLHNEHCRLVVLEQCLYCKWLAKAVCC